MKNIILCAAIFGCLFAQPSLAVFEDEAMQGPPHFQTRNKIISLEEAEKIVNEGQVTTPLGTYHLPKEDADAFYSGMNQGVPSEISMDETIFMGGMPEVKITYFTSKILPSGEQGVQPHVFVFKKD